jgi:hypothetical protein
MALQQYGDGVRAAWDEEYIELRTVIEGSVRQDMDAFEGFHGTACGGHEIAIHPGKGEGLKRAEDVE